MEDLVKVVEEVKILIKKFEEDTDKNLNGNKAAGARARKTSVELGKILPIYRKLSVEANKK
jgi:hypothetical protein